MKAVRFACGDVRISVRRRADGCYAGWDDYPDGLRADGWGRYVEDTL